MDRREYLRNYRQKMKDRTKRVTLNLSIAEHRELTKAAKVAGEKASSFVKALALQAQRREVSFPPGIENELAELSQLVRTIANNMNQMARHSHRIAHVLDENEPLAELVHLQALLKERIKSMAKERS